MIATSTDKHVDKYAYIFLPAFFNSIATMIVEILISGLNHDRESRYWIGGFSGFWDVVFWIQYLLVSVMQAVLVCLLMVEQIRNYFMMFLIQWRKYQD